MSKQHTPRSRLATALAAVLLGAFIGPGASLAAEPTTAQVEAFDEALLRLADAGQLPAAGQPVTISQPPRTRHELGAVLDLATTGSGAAVLAVTPGGAAERLGVRAGDRVLRINDMPLQPGAGPEPLRRALDAGGGALVVVVQRDGRPLELRGAADSVSLPGYQLLLAGFDGAPGSTCGRVSVFDVFPRNRQVYPVAIIAIDGRHPGPGPVFQLQPGRHVLTVSENIDPNQFSGVSQYQRSRNIRPGVPAVDADPGAGPAAQRAGSPYKDIVIDVAAGVTYHVAAQFHPDRRHEVRTNAYWEPLLFSETPEACR
jgi:membrane-associated protease RseP (regulator of RpoE activity)